MKNIFNYLRVLISIALLAALIWIMRAQLAGIKEIILSANKSLILFAMALIIFGIVLQSFRLKFLMDAQGIHLHIRDVAQLTFIGQFFNNFMPTSIGGDVVKAYYASGGTHKKLETYAAVAVDRMLGVVTLMWIALIALVIDKNKAADKAAAFIIGIICVVGLVFMALIFNKKAAKIFLFFKLERLYEATNKYRHHKVLIFHALWLSLVAQIIFFVMTYVLTLSISSEVPLPYLLLVLPVVAAVSMLPSLNGLGVRESGFVYFLGGTMGTQNAFAFSLLYLGITLFVSLLGGVTFLFKREFKHVVKGEVLIR